MEWLLNVVMRGILGAIAIYFINLGLAALGIASCVGINPVTVLTTGILGFPGLLALYGMGFYKML
ncbi:MAG: pro-sigmaK processing inhibitor BofA family protein [Lachnospiraceae bacterium]|nr:pro-sigmaK processing inhibitor BofA family protein [Lachnospiraceae bacterium]